MKSFQITIVLGLLLFSSPAHAGILNPYSCDRHTTEEHELMGTTPLPWIFFTSTIGTLPSSVFLLTDYSAPKTSATAAKQIVGYSGLAINVGLLAFTWRNESETCIPSEQSPMTDSERSEYRAEKIKQSYLLLGVDTLINGAAHLISDRYNVKMISGFALTIPIVAALLQWNRFKSGPHRDESTKSASLNFSPTFMDSGSLHETPTPGLLATLHL